MGFSFPDSNHLAYPLRPDGGAGKNGSISDPDPAVYPPKVLALQRLRD